MMGRMRSAAIVGMAVVLAFAIRVVPAYKTVFGASRVNFQDNDSWYHMRSVHNLVAHFPSQSGFDPYALFPRGLAHQNEPWDLAVASVAWLLGAGKPSASMVDRVGAWLPAILGASLPILVFLLGRRLFGELAGKLSAISVAVIPGPLLWETHLGVPDHHVAECVLSLMVLLSLCNGVESQRRARIWLAALAGFALGAYLCVRPAGVFVPGTLAVAALLEPALAPLTMLALAVASAVFPLSAGGAWTQFTWLSLGGSFAACAFGWALRELGRRRGWRSAFLLPALLLTVLSVLGITAAAKPRTFFALVANIHRYLPGGSDVSVLATRELLPIWKTKPGGVAGLFMLLGGVWIVALPALLCAIPVAWRRRRPALTLFAVWALVMTIAGMLQLRMLIYSGPAIAMAAGAGAVWLIHRLPKNMNRFRGTASVTFAAFVVAASLNACILQAGWKGGPSAGWLSALDWLSRNTPDPMATPAAWLRFWPALLPGERFTYPDTAYGVLTWWEYGDWVNSIAHRLPNSNGTQGNAVPVATFLTATGEAVARGELARLKTRYVVLNPEIVTTLWPAIVLWAHGEEANYRKTFYGAGPGGTVVPVIVYLPDYYRSMAVHLYLFDGRRVAASPEISVFTTRRFRATSGAEADGLIAVRKFSSVKSAYDYMAANAAEDLTLGSTDPAVSCVDLEDLPWVRRVFTSDAQLPVKIFEVNP